MGEIVYKPHCGKCGAIIEPKVKYMTVAVLCRFGKFIDIEPNRCPYCGEVFETIEIPMPEEIKEERGLSMD